MLQKLLNFIKDFITLQCILNMWKLYLIIENDNVIIRIDRKRKNGFGKNHNKYEIGIIKKNAPVTKLNSELPT